MMNWLGTVLLLGFFALVAFLLYYSIRSNRREKETRQRMVQSLGLTAVAPDPELAARISLLYQRPGREDRFEMRYVSHKIIPDGELYLFDLIDASGEDESITERQAVAILSSHLRLPHFTFFPKVDEKYHLSGLANRVVEWGMSKMGTPVPFPEFPAFQARYVVTSVEPEQARAFLDDRLADFFAATRMYTIHAAGDIFTFSELDPRFDTGDHASMSLRLNRAMEIFRLFMK
jgi:hypothetical protein